MFLFALGYLAYEPTLPIDGPENLPALVYVKFECVSAGHVPHAKGCTAL